jgi:hypothetical protein
MSTATSPYVFKKYDNIEKMKYDVDWIIRSKKNNKYTLFLRKVDISFPDDVLEKMIYT